MRPGGPSGREDAAVSRKRREIFVQDRCGRAGLAPRLFPLLALQETLPFHLVLRISAVGSGSRSTVTIIAAAKRNGGSAS